MMVKEFKITMWNFYNLLMKALVVLSNVATGGLLIRYDGWAAPHQALTTIVPSIIGKDPLFINIEKDLPTARQVYEILAANPGNQIVVLQMGPQSIQIPHYQYILKVLSTRGKAFFTGKGGTIEIDFQGVCVVTYIGDPELIPTVVKGRYLDFHIR